MEPRDADEQRNGLDDREAGGGDAAERDDAGGNALADDEPEVIDLEEENGAGDRSDAGVGDGAGVEAGDSSGVVQPAASAAVGGAVAADTRPPDRAERAGYPPDYGPEQAVLRVRPAFFRPNVLSVVGLIVGPALLALAAWWVAGDEYGPIAARWIGIVLGGAAVLFIAGWWFLARYSYMLEITNKRAVEHIGLFSKTTDEVLHDHVRNVTIEQSFYDRVMNVGRIGIASAGHGDTEINMDNMPRPKKIREVIDLYRPVG